MATLKNIILRPSSDITVNHTLNSGSNGYPLINETTPDGNSTMLYKVHDYTSDTASTITSTFNCTNSNMPSKFYINDLSTNVIYANVGNVRSANGATLEFQSILTPLISINNIDSTISLTETYHETVGSNSTLTITETWKTLTNEVESTQIKIILHSDSFSCTGGFTTNTLAKGTFNKNGKTASPGIEITNMYISVNYYDVFDCGAVANEGITSASVSDSEVVDGLNCVFSCNVNNNYRFAGWYDSNGSLVSTNQNYQTMISTNTTLFAKGNLLYKVSMHMVNSTCSINELSGINGETVTIPLPTPNDGYRFIGWFDNEAGVGTPISTSSYQYTISSAIGNIDIYAVSKKIHTITIDTDGHCVVSPTSYSGIIDETCTFSIDNVEDGYVFDGWYNNMDVKISNDTTIDIIINGSTTYTAKTSKSIHITVIDDEYCSTDITPTTIKAGDYVTLTASMLSSDYQFYGYYSDPNKELLLSSNDVYTFQINNDMTIYAFSIYKTALFTKYNGVWTKVSQAYKKIDGVWVLQENITTIFDQNRKYKLKS